MLVYACRYTRPNYMIHVNTYKQSVNINTAQSYMKILRAIPILGVIK